MVRPIGPILPRLACDTPRFCPRCGKATLFAAGTERYPNNWICIQCGACIDWAARRVDPAREREAEAIGIRNGTRSNPGPESVRDKPTFVPGMMYRVGNEADETADWRHAAAVAIWGGLGFGLLALGYYLAQLTSK